MRKVNATTPSRTIEGVEIACEAATETLREWCSTAMKVCVCI